MVNSDFRAAIGCVSTQTVRNKLLTCDLTPDVHGEVQLRHLDTMQRGTDGPNNMLNGLVRTDMKSYSQMRLAYALNQIIAGDVLGGDLVSVNVLDTLSNDYSRMVIP